MTFAGRSVGAVVLSSAGTVERSFTIPGAINIWAAAVDNDGSVYVDYTLQSSVDDDRLGRFGADSTTTLNVVDQGLAAPAALVWGPGHELMSVNDQLGDVTTVSSGGVVTKHAFTFQRSGSGGEEAIADRWGNLWIYSMPVLDSKGTRGNQITRYTSTSRIGGATRYDVSGAAASAAFGRDVPVVFVASGSVFPDALSGGAAAAALGGPVLLVPPSGALGSSTVRALKRLHPHAIVVLGGTASVSSAVQSALRSYAPSVARIGGADRYEVSAALSASVFSSGVARVYVATGATFPDALRGAAAAGASHDPVLLVPASGAIPDAVSAELARLHPGAITVLGGAGSVGVDGAGDLAAVAPVT
ncbi:cell wall-binding repeat-containing protein, partial [Kitasatospora herbaricolor]|uniref:cell wall-binding repeat-containing protein n=1 Tax=Kitasatospora herbaricolor TaxID=68217 RepID=UPI0036D7E717